MKTIRVLNYLPVYRDGSFLDNGIDIWTRLGNLNAPKQCRCSHTELGLPNQYGRFTYDLPPHKYGNEFHGHTATSTMRGYDNGVVLREASKILDHPYRWTYFEIVLSDEEYLDLTRNIWYDVNHNAGYDLLTILSFFTPWRWGSRKKFICSERVCRWIKEVLHKGRIKDQIKDLSCPSPIRLAHNLHLAGLDLYSLETDTVILRGAR